MNNEGEYGDDSGENESCDTDNNNSESTCNKFYADYSKRGTAKCRVCKKCISKDALRIGMYTFFKGKTIINYHHATCLFKKMQNARVKSNVVQSLVEIDGIENISDNDQRIISNLIKENEDTRTRPLVENYKKKVIPMDIRPAVRRKKLKVLGTSSIKILFTNADQFNHAKKNELENRIITEKPMIITVSEVKAKNGGSLSEDDYKIDGYNINPVNIGPDASHGRGMIVYTHSSLEKSTIQISPSSNFEEVCLLEIRLRGGDTLLFGCFYRSPTTSPESSMNNENLNRMLRDLCAKSYSHVCLVGDFNFRDINWASWSTKHGEESKEANFIETVRDCFLYQHIEKPTRIRGNDEPSLIDLLLTNEEMQVSNVVHHAPLGKSDHAVISFSFHCYLDFTKPKTIYDYRKADFNAMKADPNLLVWKQNFVEEQRNKDPESIWHSIKEKIMEMRTQYVSKKTIKTGTNDIKGSFPMNKELLNAVAEKHNLHRRWIRKRKRGDPSARGAYTKSCAKVKKLIRQARRRFEQGIATNAKANPKAFWAYVRRKLKTKSGVSPLLKDVKNTDSLKFDDREKANILQDQFSSAFTIEDDRQLPTMSPMTNLKVSDLSITEVMILEEILSLNPNKSCGPDEISPLMLIHLADFIAAPLALLMNKTLELGTLPRDWKKAYVSPIFKKGARNVAENY